MRALLLLLSLLLAAPAWAGSLLVIASPKATVGTLSDGELAAVYLAKRKSWPDGVAIVPVNREATSAVRKRFSQDVFHRSPQDVAEYWNRLRFQGKFPPLVQTSNAAVIGFVRSVPGAIGYIEADHAPAGVKVVARLP